jgi:hypothetical protein
MQDLRSMFERIRVHVPVPTLQRLFSLMDAQKQVRSNGGQTVVKLLVKNRSNVAFGSTSPCQPSSGSSA